MKELDKDETNQETERLLAQSNQQYYVLRLYVSGTTHQSALAIQNIQKICEDYLKNRYELEVIDIYQQPQLAQAAQIIAVPTLVRQLPLPLRKLVGNMSDTERVLVSLDLQPEKLNQINAT